MANTKLLPQPNSKQLKALVPGSQARLIYKVLYENRDKPLSISDLRKLLKLRSGAGAP